jgi:hypothetical protein
MEHGVKGRWIKLKDMVMKVDAEAVLNGSND